MNDITREFAKQAGITTNIDTDYFQRDMNKWVDYFSEKFADMIVAECLVTLGSIVCDTSGERDTLWVARKVVADHFGVES
jgi:hypothetical protein